MSGCIICLVSLNFISSLFKLFLQISSGYTVSTTETVKQFLNHQLNVIYLNLVNLLPLPKTVKPLYTFTKFQNEKYTVNHRLSRIKNRDDLFDSEMESDTEDKDKETLTNNSEPTENQGKIEQSVKSNAEKASGKEVSEGDKAVSSAIQNMSNMYEAFSFADSYLTLCKDKHEWLTPNLNNGSLLPGQSDCKATCDIESKNLWKTEYANEILAHVCLGNYSKTCDKLVQVIHRVSTLEENERKEVESQISLPVENTKAWLQTSELSAMQSRFVIVLNSDKLPHT